MGAANPASAAPGPARRHLPQPGGTGIVPGVTAFVQVSVATAWSAYWSAIYDGNAIQGYAQSNTLTSQAADVSQAVVIPVDDDIKGTKPVAFIIPKAGHKPTEDAIKKYALANAPAFQHPRFVWFVDELPLASTNKVDRAALMKLARERVAAAVESA